MPQSSKLARTRRSKDQTSSKSSQSVLAALSSVSSSVQRSEDVRDPGQLHTFTAPVVCTVDVQCLPDRSEHDAGANRGLGSEASREASTETQAGNSYTSARSESSKSCPVSSAPVEIGLDRIAVGSKCHTADATGNELVQDGRRQETSHFRNGHSPLSAAMSPLQAQDGNDDLKRHPGQWLRYQGASAVVNYPAVPPRCVPDELFSSLDTLESMLDARSDLVLLRGYMGNLTIYRMANSALQLVGSVCGVDGIITKAKLIPMATSGKTYKEKGQLLVLSRLQTSVQSSTPENRSTSSVDTFSTWQLHVEVHSMKNSKCLTTLFSSEVVELVDGDESSGNSISKLTRLEFELDVKGHFITITSPHSGEILLYSAFTARDVPAASYRCIGKFWTAVHIGQPEEELNAYNSESKSHSQQRQSNHGHLTSLSALSCRWLAVVSAHPMQKSVLHGISIPCGFVGDKQSLKSTVPPSSPSPTCPLESEQNGTFMNKMARGVAQEMLRGAKWVGSQGWQVWNSYWSGESAVPRVQVPSSHPKLNTPSTRTFRGNSTTGMLGTATISIYDLKTLSEMEQPKTMASVHVGTFESLAGCSFLSFSPTGLQLLVVNQNGDEQSILDLCGICPIPTLFMDQAMRSPEYAAPRTPLQLVRQVSKISRYTDAETIDVAWSLPAGNRLALSTRHGTLHVFSLRNRGYARSWTPTKSHQVRELRLASSLRTKADDPYANESTNEYSRQYSGSWSNTIQSFGEATSPLMSAAASRARSLSSGAKDAANAFPTPTTILSEGGKAVSTSLSRSLGAASESISFLRHIGRNKLRLNVANNEIKTGRMKWLPGPEGYIAILSSDSIRTHQVRESRMGTTSERRLSIDKEATHQYSLLELDRGRNRQMLGSVKPKSSSFPFTTNVAENILQQSRSLHPLAFAEIDSHQSLRSFQRRGRHRTFTIVPDETEPLTVGNHGGQIDVDCNLGQLSNLRTRRIQSHRNVLRSGSKPKRTVAKPESAPKSLDDSFEILSPES